MILLIYPLLGFKFSNAGTKFKTNNTPWKGDSHKPVKNPVDIFLIHHWAILYWGDQEVSGVDNLCKWRKQNCHLCKTWSMTQCSSLNWYNKSFINIKYSVYRDESSLLILNKKINTVKHWHDDKSLGPHNK